MSRAQPQPGEPIKRHFLLIDKAPTVWWSRGAHKGQGHEFTACKELAFGRLTRLCTQAALLKASGRQRRWDRGSRNEQEPEAGSEGQESLESPLPPWAVLPDRREPQLPCLSSGDHTVNTYLSGPVSG